MKTIIGLSGARRSGKDTVADYLVREHNFTKISFAEPLKLGLCSILGITLEELETYKALNETHKALGKTYRNMLETLGTEWGRTQVHKAIWINLLKEKAESIKGNIVISDVRFGNEIELVSDLKGYSCYIDNQLAEKEKGTHICENSISISSMDFVIENNKSLRELFIEVDDLLIDLIKQ